MFMADRQTTLDFVDALGATRCAYGTWPDGPCDCKYGWRPHAPHTSEVTGCPELRSIREALVALSDEEWERIMMRGDNTEAGSAATRPVHGRVKRELQQMKINIDRALDTLDESVREPIA